MIQRGSYCTTLKATIHTLSPMEVSSSMSVARWATSSASLRSLMALYSSDSCSPTKAVRSGTNPSLCSSSAKACSFSLGWWWGAAMSIQSGDSRSRTWFAIPVAAPLVAAPPPSMYRRPQMKPPKKMSPQPKKQQPHATRDRRGAFPPRMTGRAQAACPFRRAGPSNIKESQTTTARVTRSEG